jgi:hypothetical protein
MMRSVLDLSEGNKERVGFAVARRMAGEPGYTQSWDLVVLDKEEAEITTDHFSFTGDFLKDGLGTLAQLLDKADLGYKGSGAWKANEGESVWRAELARLAYWFRPRRSESSQH